MSIEDIKAELEENECIVYDGFEEALIGITTGFNSRAVYDFSLCVSVLMDEGMKYYEAIEHLEYNVIGGYLGEKTPLVIRIVDEVYL